MHRPSIFISHSAKPEVEPDAYATLKKLYGALTENGHDVFLDLRRINADDDWNEMLNTWMELANGAIVLVSWHAQNASHWVAREANILTWRKTRDPDFALVPVTVRPVEKGRINDGLLAVAKLDDRHAVAAEDSTFLNEILKSFEALKDRTEVETSIRQIEERIVEILRSVHERSLRQHAAKLDPTLHEWSPAPDAPRMLARLLLSAPLDQACNVIRELRSLNEADWQALVELLAPNWIDFRAAEPICRIVNGPAAKRCIAIDGKRMETLRMYIWRASGMPRRGGWKHLDVTTLPRIHLTAQGPYPLRAACQAYSWAGSNVVPRENPAPTIVRQVLDHFRCKKNSRWSETSVREFLDNVDSIQPVLALLPEETSRSILEEVRAELKALTFFMLTSEIPRSVDLYEVERNVCKRSGAYFLVPGVDPKAETEAVKRYWEAEAILGE